MYAFSFVLANFGIAIAARMPMITTTISSSMSVKPLRFIVISQMWSELPVPARSAIESLVRLHPFRANLMPCRRAVTTTPCACTGYGDDVFTLSHWATGGKSGFLQGSRPVATRFDPLCHCLPSGVARRNSESATAPSPRARAGHDDEADEQRAQSSLQSREPRAGGQCEAGRRQIERALADQDPHRKQQIRDRKERQRDPCKTVHLHPAPAPPGKHQQGRPDRYTEHAHQEPRIARRRDERSLLQRIVHP